MLAGVEKASTGTFKYGQNIKVSYYAQHQLETLDENDTVYQSIEKCALGMTERQIRTYLGGLLFSGEEIEKKVKVLSGGEKARLALGRMLLDPSNLLLLDEPTNHLDIQSKSVLKNALISFEGTLILVSHDRDFLSGLCSQVLEFKDGRTKLYLDDINTYLENKKINSLKELEKNLIKNKAHKVSSFLTIQEGCDKFCHFCVVPYTRGPEYSRPPSQILDEAKYLADNGVREITLLGQNVNAYESLSLIHI